MKQNECINNCINNCSSHLFSLPDSCLAQAMSFALVDANDLSDFASTCAAAKSFLQRNRGEAYIAAAMRRTFTTRLTEACAVRPAIQAELDSCLPPPPPPAAAAQERQLTLQIPPHHARSTCLATLFQSRGIHVTSIRVANFGRITRHRSGDDDGNDEILEIAIGRYPNFSINRELARLFSEPDGSVELMQFVKCIPPTEYHDVCLVYRSNTFADALVATVTARAVEYTTHDAVMAILPRQWLVNCPRRADYYAVDDDAPRPVWAAPPVAGLLTIPLRMHFPHVIQSFTVHAAVKGSLPLVRQFTLVLDDGARLPGGSFSVPRSMVRRATMSSGEEYYQISLEQCISFFQWWNSGRAAIHLLVQFEEQPAEPVKVVVGMDTKHALVCAGGCTWPMWLWTE